MNLTSLILICYATLGMMCCIVACMMIIIWFQEYRFRTSEVGKVIKIYAGMLGDDKLEESIKDIIGQDKYYIDKYYNDKDV